MNQSYVSEPEVKEFVYAEVRQYFTEKSNLEEDIRKDYFRIREKKEHVIHHGNRTIVILDDGSKGIAKCSPEDTYDKLTGIKIAYHRAKIKSLEKELKKLTK
jgi:hypothetical protein